MIYDAIRSSNTITLKRAFIIYVVVLLVFCVISYGLFFLIQFDITSIFLFVFLYLTGGIYLNRAVLRKIVEWHPVHSTVENVYKTKLGMIALWPILYPILILKLIVVKFL